MEMHPSSDHRSKLWILERKVIIKEGDSPRGVNRGGILGQAAPRKGRGRKHWKPGVNRRSREGTFGQIPE